ncbi:MFS transporter [Leucobacter sp. G161]|uniref:MFS transporter n=1 Tax=Leucobacter sp. G161 TaxID=663704 RepID=UPI00073B5AB0|nr:MFS transporter [Leucobacter sp. G161]KUF07133.1 MFS transporter [Leucobacter sp. G161]
MSARERSGSLPLRALLTSHALSRTGNVVTVFAIPFAVLGSGGGAIEVGLAAAASTAPVVIGGTLGGALIDRLGYVRASVLADIMSGATLALIPLLAAAQLLPFPALLALVFLGGLFDTPGETSRRVLLPPLSRSAGIPIERSIGFLDGTSRLSSLLGAPLAGILVAAVGPHPALFVTAGTFAISAALTAAAVRLPRGAIPAPSGNGYWRDLGEGFRFVAKDPLLVRIITLVVVTNALDAARSGTLMPLYAAEELGGSAPLGLIVGAFGAAALVGTIGFGYVAHRLPRRVPFALCFTVAGAFAFAPALGFHTPGMIAAAVVSGLAAGAINPILGAAQFERVPTELRGRVLGLVTAGAWAGMPLGGFLGGLGADVLGTRATFAVIGVIYVVLTLTPLLGGPWRLMERAAAEPR